MSALFAGVRVIGAIAMVACALANAWMILFISQLTAPSEFGPAAIALLAVASLVVVAFWLARRRWTLPVIALGLVASALGWTFGLFGVDLMFSWGARQSGAGWYVMFLIVAPVIGLLTLALDLGHPSADPLPPG